MSGAVPSGFRKRLQSGETVIGSFVNLASPLGTEIMGIAGFDWLVLDLEHGAGDEALLVAQLQALAAADVATLVRTEGIDLPRFMHALDAGADGVLVPRLRSADDARRCVEYSHYSGSRGVARYNRSWHWGHSQAHARRGRRRGRLRRPDRDRRGPRGRRRDRRRRRRRRTLRRPGRSRAQPRH